jgi:hypothetical protein
MSDTTKSQKQKCTENSIPEIAKLFPAVVAMIETNNDREFDSHDFISKLMELFPREYLIYLTDNWKNTAPFSFNEKRLNGKHGTLAIWLKKYGKAYCTKIGKTKSSNVYDNKSPCKEWKKI